MRRRFTSAIATLVLVVISGCATTGATFQSGVGDTFLEHPPYYAGSRAQTPEGIASRPGHLPIVFQRGASQSALFDPSHSAAMNDLLEQMNRFLDSLGMSVPLLADGGGAAETPGVPPDVQFGCRFEPGVLDEDCTERGDSALGRRGQTMRLAVARPSPSWIAWVGPIMDDKAVDRTLVITLEVGQYLIRQRGLRGTKVVELGTGYVARFPWLTSLETPVSVVQVTGALVGRDGKAVRIGAEGLLARRTSLTLSSVGAQTLITDEDVAQLLTMRRDDLPHAPLTWQEGLRALVRQLTGGG